MKEVYCTVTQIATQTKNFENKVEMVFHEMVSFHEMVHEMVFMDQPKLKNVYYKNRKLILVLFIVCTVWQSLHDCC